MHTRSVALALGIFAAALSFNASTAVAQYKFSLSFLTPPPHAADSNVEIKIDDDRDARLAAPNSVKEYEIWILKGGKPSVKVGGVTAKSTYDKLFAHIPNPAPGSGFYRFRVIPIRLELGIVNGKENFKRIELPFQEIGTEQAVAKRPVDIANPGTSLFVEVKDIGSSDRWLPMSVWALNVKAAIGTLVNGDEIAGVAALDDVQLMEGATKLTTAKLVKAALAKLPPSRFTLVKRGEGIKAATGQTFQVPTVPAGGSLQQSPDQAGNIVSAGFMLPAKAVDIARSRLFVEVSLRAKPDTWVAGDVWVAGVTLGPIATRSKKAIVGTIPAGTQLSANGAKLATAEAVKAALIKIPADKLTLVEPGQGVIGARAQNPKLANGGKIQFPPTQTKNIIELGEQAPFAPPPPPPRLGIAAFGADVTFLKGNLADGKITSGDGKINFGQFINKTFTLQLPSNLVTSGGKGLPGGEATIVAAGGGNITVSLPPNIVAAGGGNLVISVAKIVAAGGGNIVAAGGGNIVAAGGGNIVISLPANLIGSDGASLIGKGGAGIVAAGGGNILVPISSIVAAGGGNIVAAGGGNIVISLPPNFMTAKSVSYGLSVFPANISTLDLVNAENLKGIEGGVALALNTGSTSIMFAEKGFSLQSTKTVADFKNKLKAGK